MKKIVIIVVAALVLIGAGVAGGTYYVKHYTTPEPVPVPELQYVPMTRFIASVSDERQSRYLVLQISLAARDVEFLEVLKTKAPLLRNVLVKRFSTTTREQAKGMLEDVTALQQELLQQFNQALEQPEKESKLEQVLITDVFLQ